MNNRTGLLWLAAGMVIGSLGLSAVASLVTGQSLIRYTQASRVQRPSLLRAVAFRRAARGPD